MSLGVPLYAQFANIPFPYQFPPQEHTTKESIALARPCLRPRGSRADNAAENDVLQGNSQSHSAEESIDPRVHENTSRDIPEVTQQHLDSQKQDTREKGVQKRPVSESWSQKAHRIDKAPRLYPKQG